MINGLMIQLNKLEFKNKDATENLIRYITRTRTNEDKQHELVAYGCNFGSIYLKPIEQIISEYTFIQNYYAATGSLMCHYVIRITPDTFNRMNRNIHSLCCYATECCNFIFSHGHQACFAIHDNGDLCPHIHLAINTINYTNGHKLRQYPAEIRMNLEQPLLAILNRYLVKTVDSVDLL